MAILAAKFIWKKKKKRNCRFEIARFVSQSLYWIIPVGINCLLKGCLFIFFLQKWYLHAFIVEISKEKVKKAFKIDLTRFFFLKKKENLFLDFGFPDIRRSLRKIFSINDQYFFRVKTSLFF